MSLDNIQLPAIVIYDLFKNSLVDLNRTPTVSTSAPAKSFSFLGNNEKKIAIIVKDEEAIYLEETALNFLMGILAACKLTMADIALVNLIQHPYINYTNFADKINAEKILIFGHGPQDLELPLQFPDYQVQKYNDQVYLTAPHLKIIAADKTEKTKLWNSLKQLFSLA